MPHRRAVGNAGAGGTGRTGPLSLVCGGAARPTPPSRRSTRTVVSWTRGIPRRAARPTHPPSDVLSVGAPPPHPRRISARGVAFAGAPNSRWRPAPSPLAGEGGGEGCAACQRGEMEPHAPIGSAARSRAATARASAAGICFDRHARIPRRAPTPPTRRRLRPTRPPRILPSSGGCFDRDAGYLAGPPTPPTERWRVSRHPSLLPAPPRVEREPDCPRWPRRRAAPPHPRLLPRGVRHPMVLTGQAASGSRSWRCAQAVASS